MKTLVLGGYGNFGARISRALAGNPGIELVIAGRDAGRARRLADAFGTATGTLAVDCTGPDFSRTLAAHGIELVIHTAGPFQAQSYAVAHAAARAGAHYIDLADGRRFVCDFPAALNDAFREAGRVSISGASTVPALSSAVVDHLSAGWKALHAIDICIAPAQTAPRGKATMAAVLSYCGRPIDLWRDGQWTQAPGWAAPERVRFKRLQPRIGALCDVPDLELFPARYRVRDRVMFRAALEVAASQHAFAALASLHRIGLLRRPERLAGLLDRVGDLADPFGTALGGMVVRIEGLGPDARPAQRAWHIAADNDVGPEIPCMAAILLARKLASGDSIPASAHTAAGLLTLDAFASEFAKWDMVTDIEHDPTGAAR